MLLETRRSWIVCGALLVGLTLPVAAGSIQAEKRYRDATPEGIPPGFEPVDVSSDMEVIRRREQRQIEREAEIDINARYVTPERRIRARYGGATWNLYDPFH